MAQCKKFMKIKNRIYYCQMEEHPTKLSHDFVIREEDIEWINNASNLREKMIDIGFFPVNKESTNAQN